MIRISLIGGSGYAGAELLRWIQRRKDVELLSVHAHSAAGTKVSAQYPEFNGTLTHHFEPIESGSFKNADVIFVALKSGESLAIIPKLAELPVRIIDLGGDFRLRDIKKYETYYNKIHTAADILPSFVYGLPELNKKLIASASHISNPGCYPTSILLALLPAVTEMLIDPNSISIVSMSGISGAGRTASIDYSFSELNENIRAYKIGIHQHVPEIEQVLSDVAGSPMTVSFVPHLVPLTRGIYTTIHTRFRTDVSQDSLYRLYRKFYTGHPFVRICDELPQLTQVVHTNFCDIALRIDLRTGNLIITSVIDNLVKGAAGQALQNMNIMFGLNETEGLL